MCPNFSKSRFKILYAYRLHLLYVYPHLSSSEMMRETIIAYLKHVSNFLLGSDNQSQPESDPVNDSLSDSD